MGEVGLLGARWARRFEYSDHGRHIADPAGNPYLWGQGSGVQPYLITPRIRRRLRS